MGKSWVAAGGRTITDEMVERWERELETGEFFDKGVTVGGVVDGQPHRSMDEDGGMMALLRRRLVRMGDEREGKDRGKPL
nr:MAG TPA: hypothetical protein [Caudoviricetes sp.]